MKFNLLAFLFLTSLLSAQSTYFIKYKQTAEQSYVAGKIGSGRLIDARLLKGGPVQYDVTYLADGLAKDDEVLGRIIKVHFGKDDISQSDFDTMVSDPLIEYTEKAKTYKINFTPDDSLLSEQWALSKIKAFDAWDITQGSDTILLAIIDTGIDYLHSDLKNKVKINPGETGTDGSGNDKRSNGIDDDNNGFIDDYMGWDFTDRLGFPFDSSGGDYLNWDNDPMDNNGHGTYIAGTAAAETNNLTGVAGTAPGIKVLNVRAFDPNGYGEEDDAAAAILYAVRMGAKVINMSFGDNSYSFVLRDVIRYAYSRNVVLVASSGNSGTDEPHYPSGYSEVISVGNSTENDYVSSNSNWGSTLDLVAPGTFIKTTALNNSYATVSGTSLAAPFVSAAAALVLSIGNYTNDEIRQILKSTSDDIAAVGWDLRSGAGRLNLLKALSVTAPSVIKFDYPKQEFATLKDTLNISATVLSAYFTRYELMVGTGITPDEWALLKSGQNQFTSTQVYSLDITNFADSIYTLRLIVYQSNGRTTEERVNFHIMRKPPPAELVTIGAALYGNASTILASAYTEVPAIVKLYFRRASTGENFNYVTLDGFALNNQFVKYLHYGFIPKELLQPQTEYEVYLEAENLTGLKTVMKDSTSNFFITTSFNSDFSSEYEMPFRLPFGQLYENPVNITRVDTSEILFNGIYPGTDLYYGIYSFTGSGFIKSDSIKNRIPRSVGDFNGNGKTDILSTIQRSGYIDEQLNAGATEFTNKLTDTTGGFWASLVEDVDGDGKPEAVVVSTDTSLSVWNLDENLNKTDSVKLDNFTRKWFGLNRFNFPKVITADFDGDGNKEIWAVDSDGDILAFKYSAGKYLPFYSMSTMLFGSTEYISSGDFNGDGNQDIAVLLRSFQNAYIAPFNIVIVFDKNGVLFDQAFVDPSAEFNSNFNQVWNSVRLVDIDNDGKDELITFSFPYSYIFRCGQDNVKIINYKENINSRAVFVSDFNKNGVPEIAFPFSDGIRFIEFAVSRKASVPADVEGYSNDSTSAVLTWTGNGSKFFIYRGESKNNIALFDSTSAKSYTDNGLVNRKSYYYAVQGFDPLKIYPYSDVTTPVEIYVHNKSHVTGIESKSSSSVQVYFSEKINTSVLDLKSIQLEGVGIPSSVSPATQYSYLLTFRLNLTAGEKFLLVNNLKDFYGSPVTNERVRFEIDSLIPGTQFYITSSAIVNQYTIKVEFNLNVDPVSASDPANYSFDPENFVQNVETDNSSRKIIYIHLQKRRPVGAVGIEYKLTIKNLSSETGVKINSGAGSIIVLTSFAENLSGVYVYPNPVKKGEGDEKITFAGLPKKARIVIFTVSGDQLKTIEEDNGDGGVTMDLSDESGKPMGSGVYIYRIIRLDDSGSEVEEKLGKFAVIR